MIGNRTTPVNRPFPNRCQAPIREIPNRCQAPIWGGRDLIVRDPNWCLAPIWEGASAGYNGSMKAILFDNDGTLVDTRDIILASMRHCTREVLGRVIPDEVLMHKVGQPLVVQMRDFTSDEAEQDELLRVYRAHNATIHDEQIRAFPGIADMLAQLHRAGVPMGVVTSKLRVTAWHGLELTGLAPYLSCCIGAEDCEHFKPEAEPVLRGASALGLPAAECFYVGDSPFDIQAGQAAGCATIAVSWGVFGADVLAEERPDIMCDTPAELLEAASSLIFP